MVCDSGFPTESPPIKDVCWAHLGWYELECQLREILGEAVFNKAWKKELWRDVSETRCRGDSWSFCNCDLCYNEGSSGWFALEAKEEVRQWLREANPSAQFWVKPARQPGAWRVSLRGIGLSGRTIVWPLFVRPVSSGRSDKYLKNHHIVVGRVGGVGMAVFSAFSGGLSAYSNCGWMVCRLGVVAALGGGCPQVGVVCLADVSLSALPSEVGPVWCRNNYRYLDACLTVWSDGRSFSGMLLMRHVLWERKLLGMWPLILVGLVKGNGSSNACICTKPRRNGQLWTTSEGLVVTLGPVKGSTVKPGPLHSGSCGCWKAAVLQRVEDNLAKMWQANLTEWYEENPDRDNLKKEENLRKTPSGTTSKGIAGRHRLGGDGHGGGKPQDNLKKEEKPAEGDNLRRKTPLKGQPHEEGAERTRLWGKPDGGMEDHAGDGNASQAGVSRGILLWLRWLGLASFCLRALGTGRFGKETGSDIMDAVIMYAWETWMV
ncbi:hypothetical protein PAPYR_12813 [Paratrimastix pyriformis]|uniref:Uncharacterized protein n=1 Tax=Paratrimastix pyriformis TaxID=342808 RepID=A0ABQ8U2V2_9EUKA|nr:hypothetical protein PAPYR_12813 [Paratrimastix pyriformis]